MGGGGVCITIVCRCVAIIIACRIAHQHHAHHRCITSVIEQRRNVSRIDAFKVVRITDNGRALLRNCRAIALPWALDGGHRVRSQ